MVKLWHIAEAWINQIENDKNGNLNITIIDWGSVNSLESLGLVILRLTVILYRKPSA